MRTAVWDALGSKSTDPAYPALKVTRYLNDALNACYADILQANPDSFSNTATLAATSATSNQYALSSQSVPITDFAGVLEVRLTDVDGVELREVPFSDRNKVQGNAYSITGTDASPTLWTNASVSPGTPLFFCYRVWPAQLSDDSDTPAWIPPAFHDVPQMMAAKTAFSQGAESRFPPDLDEMLTNRYAQFLFHLGRRSRAPKKRRDV